MESLTCKACGRRTVTRDLPPIGIDVSAVLDQLAAAGHTGRSAPGGKADPSCTCGSGAFTWSTVVTLTVHTAGTTMLGEVSREMPMSTRGGTLTCGACSRAWDVSLPDLPPHVHATTDAFAAALASGDVRPGE